MMTMVHGRALAKKMMKNLEIARNNFDFNPCLAILYIEGDIPSEKYVNTKKKAAEKLKISVKEYSFDKNSTTEDIILKIKELNGDKSVDGIIVQLPLPDFIDRNEVLRSININKDVDVLSPDARAKFAHENFYVLPPIVTAAQYILEAHNISLLGKETLVVGHGLLVGAPLAQFARQCGAKVTVVDQPVNNIKDLAKDAEVIISGVGKENLITPDMVNDGVVIIDAGMSIKDGKLVGDIHPDVALHSSLFTPTPNGMGPLVVSSLMKNVLIMSRKNKVK